MAGASTFWLTRVGLGCHILSGRLKAHHGQGQLAGEAQRGRGKERTGTLKVAGVHRRHLAGFGRDE